MQLLRLPKVLSKVGLGVTRVYELMGDGHFPRPIRIGQRAVAWVESEVDAWIAAQADKPRVEIRTRGLAESAKSNSL